MTLLLSLGKKFLGQKLGLLLADTVQALPDGGRPDTDSLGNLSHKVMRVNVRAIAVGLPKGLPDHHE